MTLSLVFADHAHKVAENLRASGLGFCAGALSTILWYQAKNICHRSKH